MASKRRCLAICCTVTAVILILIVVTLVTLYFTVLKPKRPQIIATPVGLDSINANIGDLTLHITIGVHVLIKNPNYAGFEYDATSTSILYYGDVVGEAPVPAGEIGARSDKDVDASVEVLAEKMIGNLHFLPDFLSGRFNFTSTSSVDGKVVLLNIFKLHARTDVSCRISVDILTQTSSSSCNTDINF